MRRRAAKQPAQANGTMIQRGGVVLSRRMLASMTASAIFTEDLGGCRPARRRQPPGRQAEGAERTGRLG